MREKWQSLKMTDPQFRVLSQKLQELSLWRNHYSKWFVDQGLDVNDKSFKQKITDSKEDSFDGLQAKSRSAIKRAVILISDCKNKNTPPKNPKAFRKYNLKRYSELPNTVDSMNNR